MNLFLQALFSEVDISLSERIISSSTNNHPFHAYTETLLNYGEDEKFTKLLMFL